MFEEAPTKNRVRSWGSCIDCRIAPDQAELGEEGAVASGCSNGRILRNDTCGKSSMFAKTLLEQCTVTQAELGAVVEATSAVITLV